MNAASFVVVTVAAALSMAAQQPSPKKGKVVNVQIVVGTLADHQGACKGGKVSPTTVFVSGTNVHHCVDGVLLNHNDEKAKPDIFKKTLVQLSAGDSIRWFANAQFRVVQVRRHAPIETGAPSYPFLEEMPAAFAGEVISGAVLDLAYPVTQQYKVAFEIGKPGNRVDPDLVCSF